MKPRIRFKGGVWSCVSWVPVWIGVFGWNASHVAGYGYTPEEAYEDWRKQRKGA